MTIKDIARLSGVSITTVSRVLNNRPDVSEESRRRVEAVIQSTNYIPNNSARELVRTDSSNIGLVVRGVSNPFYTDIIHAIESAVTEAGYTLVMQQIGSDKDEVSHGAVMQREKRLRGIIFLGGRFDYTAEDLASITVPFVCCSYTNPYGTLKDEGYSSVSIADEETAREAVQYLIARGHRRIAALITNAHDRSISQLRYEGFLRALNDAGLTPAAVLCTDSYDIRGAYESMKSELANGGGDFTALFAISDNMAIGAMRALRDAGRTIPEDCSVIAIDGLELSAYIDPPLTTLCQPMEEMGQRSVKQLLCLMSGEGTHTQHILPTELREGRSVATI
ncbi:MAG: LacI family DNA-binding transcriptional regulator [Oscillospiraceae bacterium]|nr:LacI family DNA-binding transcriptional regulator [Oscillospiraceae bacterium]